MTAALPPRQLFTGLTGHVVQEKGPKRAMGRPNKPSSDVGGADTPASSDLEPS